MQHWRIAAICITLAMALAGVSILQRSLGRSYAGADGAVRGTSSTAHILSEESGEIAVRVTIPKKARFTDGAPVVVVVPPLLHEVTTFTVLKDVEAIGAVVVQYLPPGSTDSETGIRSEGESDQGGIVDLLALRDVLRYAAGDLTDTGGQYIDDRSSVAVNTMQVGMYAYDVAGISAMQVMAQYGDELPGVQWVVSHESPTIDKLITNEFGYFTQGLAVHNQRYAIERYAAHDITLEYSNVHYDASAGIYFDLNGDERVSGRSDYVLPRSSLVIDGRNYYSYALLAALAENLAAADVWPEDIATPSMAAGAWGIRSAVGAYPLLQTHATDLRTMLVFAETDHAQPAEDKPHIRQAFDGLSAHTPWVRLNPDAAYVGWVNTALGTLVPDNDANDAPSDWTSISTWGYPNTPDADHLLAIAAVAEMVDRTHENNWDDNVDVVLIDVHAPHVSRQ